MSLPWERKPDPGPPQRPEPPMSVSARNPETGTVVKVTVPPDIREMMRQALVEAAVENKDILLANGKSALAAAVTGRSPEVHLEQSFEAGPATVRTFIQGAVLDIGAAVFAVVATMIGPDFNAFDKEAWTIVGVMMVKTVVQTAMSYTMKMKVR